MNPKVLHIIDSGGLYGAEMVLLNLVAEQINLGLDPTIASIGEKHISEKPLEAEAIKRGFRVVKFRMLPGPNIYGMWQVLRYAQKHGFDILHSHGYKGDVAFGFLPKKIRKIPLVSTLHGWTSTNGLSKNSMYEWLQRKSLRHIDAVVLVNKGMLYHPRLKNLNGVNFHVVNNGIPINNAVTQATQQTQQTQATQKLDKTIISFCQRGFTIGSIGRLSTEKGYRYLIEALALLIKEGVDARLIIIGEGYERTFLEGLAVNFDLSTRVMLPGYRENAKRYLPLFNVFTMSSLTEGLPITLLEAMQARVPIVATRVGGIPDALANGEAGLLVESQNAKALAEAIIRMHKQPASADKLANEAYHRLSSEYSSQSMALGYLRIYNLFQPNSP